MKNTINEEINSFIQVLNQHGIDLIQALLVLTIGLVVLHWMMKKLKVIFHRQIADHNRVTAILGAIYIIALVIIISMILVVMDFDNDSILRLLIITTLAAVAALILLKPYIPALPFVIGNTVKIGRHLGKIEAISLTHTQMKTFDGKTVFIPNTKTVTDFVINYHFTSTRQIKINIPIRNINEILAAKRLLEQIMIDDPRILLKPARPVVYVINLINGCVELGARCWVNNNKFWVTQCEMLEKFLSAMEREGIKLAFRSQEISLTSATSSLIDNLRDDNIPGPETSTDRPVSAENPFSAIHPKDIEI